MIFFSIVQALRELFLSISRRNIFALTQRKALIFSNFVLALCSLALFVFSMIVCVTFYRNTTAADLEGTFNSLYNWLLLALAGLCLAVICVIGMRGAYLVSLEHLMIYFWGVTFFVAPLILETVICFDFYVFLGTWFKHNWQMPEFLFVRQYFCAPGTADTKCVAPIAGGPNFEGVDAWCQGLYNATDCQDIRDRAVSRALRFGENLTLSQGCVALFNLLQICASIYTCFKILTIPVITKSMNDKINLLQLQPIAGTAAVASLLWGIRKLEDVPMYWIPPGFVATAVILAVQVPIGVIGGRLKSHIMLAISILLLSIALALSGTLGTACLIFAVFVKNVLLIRTTRTQAESIACALQLTNCCCCDDPTAESTCPEWSTAEIIAQLSTNMRICGIVSFLCMFYIIGAIIVSEVVRQNLKNYKTDYI